MLIGELAIRTGLTRHAIRFYEQEGLIDQRYVTRGENNYRDYSPEVVDRIALIKFGQTVGFTLAEAKELLVAADAGDLGSYEQVNVLREKLEEVERKIAELERVRALLIGKLALVHQKEHAPVP